MHFSTSHRFDTNKSICLTCLAPASSVNARHWLNVITSYSPNIAHYWIRHYILGGYLSETLEVLTNRNGDTVIRSAPFYSRMLFWWSSLWSFNSPLSKSFCSCLLRLATNLWFFWLFLISRLEASGFSRYSPINRAARARSAGSCWSFVRASACCSWVGHQRTESLVRAMHWFMIEMSIATLLSSHLAAEDIELRWSQSDLQSVTSALFDGSEHRDSGLWRLGVVIVKSRLVFLASDHQRHPLSNCASHARHLGPGSLVHHYKRLQHISIGYSYL